MFALSCLARRTLCGATFLCLLGLGFSGATTCKSGDDGSGAGTQQPHATSITFPSPTLDPVPMVPGSFSIVVIPDPQYAVRSEPVKYNRQIDWIIDQKRARNILGVITVGDNTDTNSAKEWTTFSEGMKRLGASGIPYILPLGNHDYTHTEDRESSRFGKYFSSEDFQWPGEQYGVFPDTLSVPLSHNYYMTVSVPNRLEFGANAGRRFLILALEFAPRDIVLDWANGIIAQFPDTTAVIATHAYLYNSNSSENDSGERYDFGAKGDTQRWCPHCYDGMKNFVAPPSPYPAFPFSVVADLGYPAGYQGNDGEEIWNKLARNHANVALVLSGHVNHSHSTGRQRSVGTQGNVVHEILSDYQTCDNCGTGGHSSMVRILEFAPDGKTLAVKTYSPLGGNFMAEGGSQFSVSWP